MSGFGLALLVVAGLAFMATGLPAYLVLVNVASIGAAVGVAAGTIPLPLLAALPGRIVSLLESDLLQALPMFVLMGALMERLPVASALFQTGASLLPGRRGAIASGVALGAVLGPMNGSVGASALALSEAVLPRLVRAGVPAPLAQATVAVAATLGVVIPPSLVLILLGDAMLTAHTIAVNATGKAERIINTQDIFRGVLLPAGLVALGTLAVGLWQVRGAAADRTAADPHRPADIAVALVALAVVVGLLVGVASGRLYAVEAAATGACLLLVAALASGLSRAGLADVLARTMATTGALFALLVAATTFTLVLRMLGTDRLVGDALTALPGSNTGVTALVLLGVGACALVFDAFEIIFVVIPIVAPPLLMRGPDPVWVAVLMLLALQASFLIPPLGYAFVITRSLARPPAPAGAMMRALAPFVLLQAAIMVVVLVQPRLVHFLDEGGTLDRAPAVVLSPKETEKALQGLTLPTEEDSAPLIIPR